MVDEIYQARMNHTQDWYPQGPGHGLDYYSGYMDKSMVFSDEATANKAAKIANVAYEAGYKRAQHDIRQSLGIEEK